MNWCGERETLVLERIGQQLVVRTLQRLSRDCNRREERELRRRASEGLEDSDVQEHAGERDRGRVHSAAPGEKPHVSGIGRQPRRL